MRAAQLLLTTCPQAGDTGTAARPGAGAQADHFVTRAGKEDFPSLPREQELRIHVKVGEPRSANLGLTVLPHPSRTGDTGSAKEKDRGAYAGTHPTQPFD